MPQKRHHMLGLEIKAMVWLMSASLRPEYALENSMETILN